MPRPVIILHPECLHISQRGQGVLAALVMKVITGWLKLPELRRVYGPHLNRCTSWLVRPAFVPLQCGGHSLSTWFLHRFHMMPEGT